MNPTSNVFMPTTEVMALANRLAALGENATREDIGDAAASLAYLTGQRDLAEMLIRATRIGSFMEGLEHGYYECRQAHKIQDDAPSQVPRTHGRAIDVLKEKIAALQEEEEDLGSSSISNGPTIVAYQSAIKALEVERP